MQHYESVSSKVINSFLAAGRSIPGTRMTAKEFLARQFLARQSFAPITPDFFTPNPQRFKGKSRAGIGPPQVDFLPDELKQECARTWLLNTVFWERCRFEGMFPHIHISWTDLPNINECAGLDLDRIVFAYSARLPRHCTPARSIPSSQRRHSTPRHFSPRIAYSPPRPRLFSDTASRCTSASSSPSTSEDIFSRVERLALPLCPSTPEESADPDKAWEAFLAMAEIKDLEIPRRLRPILFRFATRLADGAFTITCDSSSTPIKEMSSRAAKVRKIVEVITKRSYPLPQQRDDLEVRCKALEGHFEEAETVLGTYFEIDTSEDPLIVTPIIEISRTVVQVIGVLDGPEAAYSWLIPRWRHLERYLWSKSSLSYPKTSRAAVADLHDTLARVVDRIEDPGDFLTKGMRAQPDGPWTEVGAHFIDVLCALQLPSDALEVMREMTRLAIPPPVKTKFALVRALAKGKGFQSANELYEQVCREMDDVRGAESRELWSTGLYLHAREGNIEQATEVFTRLKRRGWINFETITLMLHVTAVKGLVKETIRTFEQFFPPRANSGELKYGKPTGAHYTEILFAHAQARDMDHVHIWLTKMIQDDITPDHYIFAILVKGFTSTGNVTSLSKLLERMKSTGVTLNLYGYTTIISFLARTGDSVEAERTYRQALRHGVKPDIKMLNALMYAHVQSGHWEGVVNTFGYIKSLPGKRYRPTTSTYNILLKAFVSIGTPFSTIRDLVIELETIGTRPDSHTFAILIQSACDHKEFDAALGLLAHMDKPVSKTRLDLEVTVYSLTILMGSFLRNGDKVRARDMFEQMKSRNIIPSATTYSSISYAYAQDNTSNALELAETFLGELISEESDNELRAGWVSTSGGRSLALDTLYQPLMHIYAKLRRVEDVERLQQELLAQGGKTSLGYLAALLAAHRNCGDVAAGRETWSRIYDMAFQRSKLRDILSGDETNSKTTSDGHREVVSQPNILCVPLSIYIDLLSSAGYHTEVAKVWDQLRTHGFAFDSHNWNHLIIALIRAGEPERAFAILERVILPNTPSASSTEEAENGRRPYQPDSPLSIVDGNNEVSLPVEEGSPVEASAWAEANVHRHNRRMEGVSRISKYLESHLSIDIGPRGDFAYSLETLQLIPFTWNSWRPHPVTLSVLSHALARLASGSLLRPIQGNSDPSAASHDEVIPTSEPAKVLRCIYADYRKAVMAVKDFERWEDERGVGSAKNEQSVRWT